MCPRPYQLGQRTAAIERTRARIVEAARELLNSEVGVAGFTVDSVAKQAGVARMTVYYQFGSKAGLLEALFDYLAARGRIDRLRLALEKPDPLDALDSLITVFGGFWASDRIVMRRIRALGAIDADVEKGVRARDARRRRALEVLVDRLARKSGRPGPRVRPEAVDLLHAITSFETFDTVAGTDRDIEQVTPLLQALARAVLTATTAGRARD
jgi:AcrR family transcriptional regulator